MQYNPGVYDRSGEIMAAGQIGAAQSNAQMMGQLGQDIGGALTTIGGMYGEIEGNKAKGRAFKDVFKVIAPSAGIDMKQLEALTGGSLKNDLDWFNVSQTFGPLLPSLINAQLGGQRLGVQQNAPYVAQDIKNRQNIASGNVPYGGGMAPVEPPLPVADENLPAVGGAPMAAPSTSVPGGQASIDAINRDRQRRGLPPIK